MRLPSDFVLKKPGNPWFSWHYFTSNTHTIESAAREHIILTLLSVGIGIALAMPLAVFARQSKWIRGGLLGFSSAVYAVPSLAAVVAFYPIFGLSRWTVVLPLAGYSLVILLRNFLTGLDEVPKEAIDAAVGMGMSPVRILLRVRLPLALPAIIAGVRLATVSTIELAVIGAYVGSGGFGEQILEGLRNNFYKQEITCYVILTILLAVVADLLLLGVQRLASPWQRTARA